MPEKLIAFDIDGTLLRANGAGRLALANAIKKSIGKPVSSNGIEFAGRTDDAILSDLLTSAGFSEEPKEILLKELRSAYRLELASILPVHRVDVLPGVMELLTELSKQASVHIGLLTGNYQATAKLKLQRAGLDHFFGVGSFGSDHRDRNRLPGILLERFNRHFACQLPSVRMIVIGDTPKDIECARVGGARVVAVATGTYSRDELAEHNPDLLLNSLADKDLLIPFLLDENPKLSG